MAEKYISLSGENGKGKRTILDADDYERYANMKWYLSSKGYAISGGNRGGLRLHRLIMNCPPDKVVDHLNGDILDNRKKNLRICTQAENMKNRHGVKGYSYDKSKNNWIVRYRSKYYGRYDTEEDAKRAYQLAKSGKPLELSTRKYPLLPKHISKQYGKYVVGIKMDKKRYRKVAIPTLADAIKIRNCFYKQLGMEVHNGEC